MQAEFFKFLNIFLYTLIFYYEVLFIYKLAIVGATGLVGKTILKILEEKNLPIYEYVLFSSKKSAGKIINFKGKDYTVRELTINSWFSNSKIRTIIFDRFKNHSPDFTV